jgi:hypothetical protein
MSKARKPDTRAFAPGGADSRAAHVEPSSSINLRICESKNHEGREGAR